MRHQGGKGFSPKGGGGRAENASGAFGLKCVPCSVCIGGGGGGGAARPVGRILMHHLVQLGCVDPEAAELVLWDAMQRGDERAAGERCRKEGVSEGRRREGRREEGQGGSGSPPPPPPPPRPAASGASPSTRPLRPRRPGAETARPSAAGCPLREPEPGVRATGLQPGRERRGS